MRARAVVLVNHDRAEGHSAHLSLLKVDVRIPPNGPQATVRGYARGYQAALITHGMEVPVLLDEHGRPESLDADGLDEAIGRYYQQRDPAQFATWEDALAHHRRIYKQQGQIIAPIRWEVEAAVDTAKALPGALRETVRSWRGALRGLRETKIAARVTAIHATDEANVYDVHLQIMDTPAGRPEVRRQVLTPEEVARLQRVGWTEVDH